MNKRDLITTAKGRVGASYQDCEAQLDAMLDVIGEELASGGEVRIHGFGVFKAVERKAREARNPKTGETIQIPAKRVVRFVPGKELKNRLA